MYKKELWQTHDSRDYQGKECVSSVAACNIQATPNLLRRTRKSRPVDKARLEKNGGRCCERMKRKGKVVSRRCEGEDGMKVVGMKYERRGK